MIRLFLSFTLTLPALGMAHAVECLSPDEQRAAISSKYAIALGDATKAAFNHHKGDVIDVRLCRQNERLAYFLTIVDKQGKVVRAVIDAKDASVLSVR